MLISVISFDFVFTSPTNGISAGGIFPALLGTVLLVIVALLASVPLGVTATIYLSEYTPDNWFTRAINLAIINLAGVSSIVRALLGVGIFVIFFKFGTSILAVSLDAKATTLSLEKQQILCIARLFPVKPSVLLVDEPCSGLDYDPTVHGRMSASLKFLEIIPHVHPLNSMAAERHNLSDQPVGLPERTPCGRTSSYSSR